MWTPCWHSHQLRGHDNDYMDTRMSSNESRNALQNLKNMLLLTSMIHFVAPPIVTKTEIPSDEKLRVI